MDDKTKESLNEFLNNWMDKDKEFNMFDLMTGGPTDWTSRERFLDLWDKAKGSEKWPWFHKKEAGTFWTMDKKWISIDLISQPTFAEEWAKFLGWKEES